MKNFTRFKLIATVAFTMIMGKAALAQWEMKYVPSQYWPTNDIKSHNGQLYAATNDGVFASADNGATWTSLTQTMVTGSFREMVFTDANEIFVRSTNSVVRSLDGGTTWEYDTAGVGLMDVKCMFYDAVSNQVFIGLGYPQYALYAKLPTDASWIKMAGTSLGNNFSPVQITRNGNELIVIDIYGRVFGSSDDGITWVAKAGTNLNEAGASDGATRLLSIDGDLYLGHAGVWKSEDNGDTWMRLDTGFALSFGIFVDSRGLYYDGSTLYASVYVGNTYTSTDKGQSWTDMGETEHFFISMTTHNNALYAAGFGKDSVYVNGTPSGGTDTTDTTMGINPLDVTPKLSIYPNPFSASATLQLHGLDIKNPRIQVLNVHGQVVETLAPTGTTVVIERGSKKPGMYFLQLSDGDKVAAVQKIAIE